MTLSPDMLNCAVRLRGTVGDATPTIGTGFFLTIPSEADRSVRYGYFLTAHHVVHEHTRVIVEAPDPATPGQMQSPVELAGWRHPVATLDLAIAPFDDSGGTYTALAVEIDVVPYGQRAPLGGDLFYIGIFAPLDRAVARRGTIAAIDQEGVDFGSSYDVDYDYVADLIDCRSFDGFSGSPCFYVQEFAQLQPVANLPPWAQRRQNV